MTPEKPKRSLWVVHVLEPRPQFHVKKRKNQERKKKREMLGLHQVRAPPERTNFAAGEKNKREILGGLADEWCGGERRSWEVVLGHPEMSKQKPFATSTHTPLNQHPP